MSLENGGWLGGFTSTLYMYPHRVIPQFKGQKNSEASLQNLSLIGGLLKLTSQLKLIIFHFRQG